MQLLLLVLNRVEKLVDLLNALLALEISGAIVFNSKGMVRELSSHEEEYQPIFASLTFFENNDCKENKIIFLVLKDSKVEKARNVIREVIGDMSQPDTAMLFTLPVLSAEGIEV